MASDFLKSLSDMLGISKQETSEKLEDVKIDDMIDLVDAVKHDDKEKVEKMFATESEEMEAVKERARKLLDPNHQKWDSFMEKANSKRHFAIGDDVVVDGKEGTVKISHAPNDTVGVIIDGELTMVKKADVDKLDEHVLGMTNIPDLQRMRELAGVQTLVIEPEVSCDDEDIVGDVMRAIDKLEQNMGDLSLRDAKAIKDRLMDIINAMNS